MNMSFNSLWRRRTEMVRESKRVLTLLSTAPAMGKAKWSSYMAGMLGATTDTRDRMEEASWRQRRWLSDQESEKLGGGKVDLQALNEFNNFMVQGGLSEPQFSGNSLAWGNNRQANSRICYTRLFHGSSTSKRLASTLLILLPKVKNPNTVSDLRPISLCSFVSKVIFKILNDRLSSFLVDLISEEQSSFVKGRSIHENIALEQELVHYMNTKIVVGNLISKIDMSKAYDDIVDCGFLMQALRHFGFNVQCCDLIYKHISNYWYTISLNGAGHGFFKSSRGLRQGDPLSPSIFILVQAVLTRNLKARLRQGVDAQYVVSRSPLQDPPAHPDADISIKEAKADAEFPLVIQMPMEINK
ncbi:hypothetical protein RJ639_043134 [Escallonia herrerae]|uniref:Reverse transcriptase domain-containing protein n=1 Tax=Escallonia herrerae TaxID=1293975 RepID=A0AA88WGZ3_9ASTE|nr:hypothetical protein RJ639_043134 [Escallonia herrerae]